MIAIVLEGGLVQAVVTDDNSLKAGTEVMIVDYDIDGADDLVDVKSLIADRGTYKAYVRLIAAEKAEIDLADCARQLE